ncbi:hypothetical protein [Micrococcus lylae]|uniref:hypothetical protein n=1 Tax=Micrococcus lylae TaxID=1273 RepID=UPI000B1394A1|nr:hypothetical protein [Micrococcus lylae]
MSIAGGGAHGQPSVGHDRTNLLLPITVAFVLLLPGSAACGIAAMVHCHRRRPPLG